MHGFQLDLDAFAKEYEAWDGVNPVGEAVVSAHREELVKMVQGLHDLAVAQAAELVVLQRRSHAPAIGGTLAGSCTW